jgi:PadR family transcriptional regulator PadR
MATLYRMAVEPPALTQLRRGALEHCVLALLEGEERYGYDLVAELSTAGLLASEGTIYPLLSRLRKDDLVATTWRESASGPPRRYYSLTRAGAEALDAFRDAWGQFSTSVNHILSRKGAS